MTLDEPTAAELARSIGGGTEGRQAGESFIVRCIAHQESTSSLHSSDKPGGGMLRKDFGGCSQETITAALKARGFLPNRNPHSLLRLKRVLEIDPVSASTRWAGVRTGRFPRPVKLGPRTTCWRARDVFPLIEQAAVGEGPR